MPRGFFVSFIGNSLNFHQPISPPNYASRAWIIRTRQLNLKLDFSSGQEGQGSCFNLLIAALPSTPPAHFSYAEFLRIADPRIVCQELPYGRKNPGYQDFFHQVARSALRLAVFLKTGLEISSPPYKPPVLADNFPISFAYGSNLAFCLYSTISNGNIGIDGESLELAPREFSAMAEFLGKIFCYSKNRVHSCNKRAVFVRLWTIYEAFYKLMPDKRMLLQGLRDNNRIFLRSRAATVYFGKKAYYFRSFALRGHWLTMAADDPEILYAFAPEWLTLRDLVLFASLLQI